MGLDVGDKGLRRAEKDGERDKCSDALLKDGVAGVYWSLVVMCGSAVVR